MSYHSLLSTKMKKPHSQQHNNHQSQAKTLFELKQKVVTALNKLSDRDTHQIGVEELDRTARSLTADSVSPFLSCLLDTDSDQKASVRKECVRLMATVAAVHGDLVLPYLPKMVSSIVRRLRDADSVVRDTCVDAVGVLASKIVNGCGGDRAFVAVVRPIFEALGEQNKNVQSGSAMCLARIVDNTSDPPVAVLQKMLGRTLKLLKNPHFMAKPALVELNKSIIQGGGAPSENVLSTAIASIQEALKDSDWATRKAAAVALGEIGLSGASFLTCLRASCIRSLESCRFDKVKPVRDAVLQALKYWRILPGPNTPEPSETGSSIKENICRGESADLSSTTESGQRDLRAQKVNTKSTMGRVPLSARKGGQNYAGNPQHLKDDWHVEIAVPRTHSIVEFHSLNEDSESSSVTKPLETISVEVTSVRDIGYEYVPMDDKQECSSVSNLTNDNYETKFLAASHECFIKNGFQKPLARSEQFVEEGSCNEQMYSIKSQNPRSSGSTITEKYPHAPHECCCVQLANDMICIQNQLSDMEIKQANMMHQLQMFTTGIMDALSTIQSRMVGLENVIDRLTQESAQGGRHSYSENSKFFRPSQNTASPRFSTCTPRPSVDINGKPSGLSSNKKSESWEEKKTFSRSQPRNFAGDTADSWKSYKPKNARNFTEKDMLNSSANDTRSMISTQVRKNDDVFSCATRVKPRIGCRGSNTNYWKCVKRLVSEGDLNSAYMESLCSGDELILVELLNKTGPVIESLSVKTVNVLLSTLASYILEGRFFNTIIPWLQQIVEMSTIHGPNCIALSIEVKEQLISAVQEAGDLTIISLAERRCATELAMKLHHIWGKINETS
ncbi:TORTIFOLIA1-like protein 2 [Arachis duranensis]|uniref:TORTIFOLIA1-like protein 2 n=2 Tax=Arachis TaxID=3817 RepID=A0A6P4CUX9_ARADU|nr:TORTIFOLIA1-like protein 2 [Arachis duranensis]